MTEFRPGQPIILARLRLGENRDAEIGATGVVQECQKPGGLLYVNWDRSNRLCHSQMDGGYYPGNFDALQPSAVGVESTINDLVAMLAEFEKAES